MKPLLLTAAAALMFAAPAVADDGLPPFVPSGNWVITEYRGSIDDGALPPVPVLMSRGPGSGFIQTNREHPERYIIYTWDHADLNGDGNPSELAWVAHRDAGATQIECTNKEGTVTNPYTQYVLAPQPNGTLAGFISQHWTIEYSSCNSTISTLNRIYLAAPA